MDKRLISEIALRCNDTGFKDFQRNVYERAFLRASRAVAKRYKLIQRELNFKVEIPVKEGEDETTVLEEKCLIDVIISVPSFTSEYKVVINNIEYTKVRDIKIQPVHENIKNAVYDYNYDTEKIGNSYEYVLYRDQNKIYFNYSPRSLSDSIHLRYTSDINIEDYDIEELEPVIPSQYEEELIKLTLTEIAKLGIVKFNESAEGGKYTNVLRLYSIDERVLENNLIKDTPWIKIKPQWVV